MDDTPIEQLKAAAARRHRLLRQLDQIRGVERALIFEVLESKAAKQADVARITGYTREHIRRLDDAEGETRGAEPRAARVKAERPVSPDTRED